MKMKFKKNIINKTITLNPSNASSFETKMTPEYNVIPLARIPFSSRSFIWSNL